MKVTPGAVDAAARIIAWGRSWATIKVRPTKWTYEKARLILEVAVPLLEDDDYVAAQMLLNIMMDLGYETEDKSVALWLARMPMVEFVSFAREVILRGLAKLDTKS